MPKNLFAPRWGISDEHDTLPISNRRELAVLAQQYREYKLGRTCIVVEDRTGLSDINVPLPQVTSPLLLELRRHIKQS